MIASTEPRVFGYGRRSRDVQILSLEVQCERIRKRAEREGWTVDHIFTETESGREVPCMERPEWVACWNSLQEGDVLIVWQLRRIDRDAGRLIACVDALVKRGVRIVVLEMMGQDIDFSTTLGQLICAVMAYFAKWEEEGRIEAIKGGLAPLRQGWLRYRVGSMKPGFGRKWVWTKVPEEFKTRAGSRYRDKEAWDERECGQLREIWIRHHRLHQSVTEIGRLFFKRREKRAQGCPWVRKQIHHERECIALRPFKTARPKSGWGCFTKKPCRKYPDFQPIRKALNFMDKTLKGEDVPPELALNEGLISIFIKRILEDRG